MGEVPRTVSRSALRRDAPPMGPHNCVRNSRSFCLCNGEARDGIHLMAHAKRMPVISSTGGTKAHIRVLHKMLEEFIAARPDGVRVLEAGVADRSYFRFAPPVAVTGIDISAKELEDDRYSERIIGDIQTYTPDKPYDIVICWYVLEHVPDPQTALLNLLQCTMEDGLLVIAVPNVWSLKGLLTKFTPFAIHRAVRSIAFSSNGDYDPFKTYLRLSMSPRNIIKQCSAYEILYKGYSGIAVTRFARPVYQSLIWLLRMLSVGSYRPDLSEFILAVRKRSDPCRSEPEAK